MKYIEVDYQVDDGVPIPIGLGITKKLKSLDINESFVFPLEKRKSIQPIASRIPDKSFTIRKINDEQCRVWRVK